MVWDTRVAGTWRSSDDLTIDELESIEKVSGVGWGYLNPLANARAARALYAVWLVRDGKTDDDAADEVGKLTAKTLKNTFRYVEDEETLPETWEEGLPADPPKDPAPSSTAT